LPARLNAATQMPPWRQPGATLSRRALVFTSDNLNTTMIKLAIALLAFALQAAAYKSIVIGQRTHEDISELAWTANNMDSTWAESGPVATSDRAAFYRGTQYPDAPCENDEESPEICVAQMSGDAIIDASCTIFWRMTFGDLSMWHSMASGFPGVTNQEVRNGVIAQIGRYYNFALNQRDSKRAWFAIGKIAHSIQDSYSKSHTVRQGSALQVQRWSYYGAQDKHGIADKDITDTNHAAAVARTTELVGHFKNRASWDTVREWLVTIVYPLVEGSESQIAGGSDPRYGCDDGTNCKGPKVGTIPAPSRSMKITIINSLGYDVTYKDHIMAKSGGGCFSCYSESENGQMYPSFKSALPCEVIKAGESCTWSMESCGIMTGLEAWFVYDARGQDVKIHVRNSWSKLYANIFTIDGVKNRLNTGQLKGDHAVVAGELLA